MATGHLMYWRKGRWLRLAPGIWTNAASWQAEHGSGHVLVIVSNRVGHRVKTCWGKESWELTSIFITAMLELATFWRIFSLKKNLRKMKKSKFQNILVFYEYRCTCTFRYIFINHRNRNKPASLLNSTHIGHILRWKLIPGLSMCWLILVE